MGARRDSNYWHSYHPSIDFLVYLMFSLVTSLSFGELYLPSNNLPIRATTGSILYNTLRHKARNPIIGARNRASALRVALSPELAFCAIAPVG